MATLTTGTVQPSSDPLSLQHASEPVRMGDSSGTEADYCEGDGEDHEQHLR